MSDDARRILAQLSEQADWYESLGRSWDPDDIREFVAAWQRGGRNTGWQNSNAGAVLGIVCGVAIIAFWVVIFWMFPDFFEFVFFVPG